MFSGTTPNSTAVLPRTASRQRKTGWSAVDKSDTSSFGPIPSSLMLRYEPGFVGARNLYWGLAPCSVGDGVLQDHWKFAKPTLQSSMYSRDSQLRLLQVKRRRKLVLKMHATCTLWCSAPTLQWREGQQLTSLWPTRSQTMCSVAHTHCKSSTAASDDAGGNPSAKVLNAPTADLLAPPGRLKRL